MSQRYHDLLLRVYLEDVDNYGIVYHPKYLQYLERARIEYLRQSGCDLPTLKQQGFSLVIQSAEIHFVKPAFNDNELLIQSYIDRLGHASIRFSQRVMLANDPDYQICKAQIKIACVDQDFKLCPLPQLLQEIA